MELQMQQQRQRDAQRQAAEEARQKNSGLKWAAKAQANPAPAPVKSLLEIQAEEEKELKKVITCIWDSIFCLQVIYWFLLPNKIFINDQFCYAQFIIEFVAHSAKRRRLLSEQQQSAIWVWERQACGALPCPTFPGPAVPPLWGRLRPTTSLVNRCVSGGVSTVVSWIRC